MVWLRVLDGLTLLSVTIAPLIAWLCALTAFRTLLRREWPALLLIIAAVVGFFRFSMEPATETFSQAIIHADSGPWFASYRTSIIEERHTPLWMGSLGLGMPSMANLYQAFSSPLSLLALISTDPVWTITILIIAHLCLAAINTYLLARSVGIPVLPSLLSTIPFIWNEWVFRRLGWEIHATYLFGYAWLPLLWALLLRFLRTNRLFDAARAAVPLGMVALGLPTILVFATMGINVLLLSRGLGLVLRRSWYRLAIFGAGSVLLYALAVAFALPEHIAGLELLHESAGTRISAPIAPEKWNPRDGGWRLRDLSAREFLRSAFPGEIGARLFPVERNIAFFGVPFSPGDIFVALALFGLGASLFSPKLRQTTAAIPHTVLVFLLAGIFTRGIVFNPVWRWYPLFNRTGIFPVVGAILLLLTAFFSAVGLWKVLTLLAFLGRRIGQTIDRRIGARFLTRPWVTWSVFRSIVLIFSILLVAEHFVGIAHLKEWHSYAVNPGVDRPGLKYTFLKMPFSHFRRMPHFDHINADAGDLPRPLRIYCLSDDASWPSPCFEFLTGQYGLAFVGPPEIGWALPANQRDLYQYTLESWPRGSVSTEFLNLLRLSAVTHITSTRKLPLPLIAEFDWKDAPTAYEGYGYFNGRLQKVRDIEWSPSYVPHLFVHRVPDILPLAFVAPAAILPGDGAAQDATMKNALASSAVDPSRLILLDDCTACGTSLPQLPVITPDELTVESLGEAFFAPLTPEILAQGHWRIKADLPNAGAVFVSQSYYPGFRAYANGVRVPIERAYGTFQAVPLPAGRVTLDIVYAPAAIYVGGVVSLAVTIVLMVWTIRRTRGRHSSSV